MFERVRWERPFARRGRLSGVVGSCCDRFLVGWRHLRACLGSSGSDEFAIELDSGSRSVVGVVLAKCCWHGTQEVPGWTGLCTMVMDVW